jgi:hypothetical protein
MCNNVCGWRGVLDWHCYGKGIRVIGGSRGIDGTSGLDALALSLHVTLLSFLQFRKILGNVFYVDEGSSAVVASLNGFKLCSFWGKTNGGMQVAHGRLKAWLLVDVVDVLPTMCK